MDLNLSAADREFVAAAERFLAAHWRASDALLVGRRGQLVRERYLRALAESGHLVAHWPKAHGGRGWTARERWLWEREVARVQAPQPSAHGPDLLATALIQHGTQAQQRAHLPAIAQGSVSWCQAFGEDSGGLDIEQVATRALPTADGWMLDGEKPWVLDVPAVQGKQQNEKEGLQPGRNWVYLLARTDTAQVSGFGLFLVDLASQGITLTPKRMIGEEVGDTANKPVRGRYSVGAVTLSAVTAPKDALLGPIETEATLALGIEQAELALPGAVARNAILLTQLRQFVESGELDGGSLWRDDDYRTKLHDLEVAMASLSALEARAMEVKAQRNGSQQTGGQGEPLEFARAANLLVASRSRQLSQELADLQVEALGYFALPYANLESLDNEGPIGPEFSQPVLFGMLSNRAREAVLAPRDHLKNIIAKSVLGLSSATLP